MNKKIEFLEKNIVVEFRNAINSSEIFLNDKRYKHKHNLTCVILDRIDSCVDYLNEKAESLQTEEDFIGFMVFASILRDGISVAWEKIVSTKPPYCEEKKYFLNVKYKNKFWDNTNEPTDDTFFEYLRAITFAHPYEVDKRNGQHHRPFMDDEEIQCSPWVISKYLFEKNKVGFRIYSSVEENDSFDILIPFDDFKLYLKTRFLSLNDITKWVRIQALNQNEEWKKDKVSRTGTLLDVSLSIKRILESRYQSTYTIDDVIYFLNFVSSDERNNDVILNYKNDIIRVLPKACDAIDSLDYESFDELFSFMDRHPKDMPSNAEYELEKIHTNLNYKNDNIIKGSNEDWGLIQLNSFMNGFAKKWIHINIETMSYQEIKLLVKIACYCEYNKQNSNRNKLD